MYRTHTCGELSRKDAGKTVSLAGWVDTTRIGGKIGFLDLRDRYGKTQVFLNAELAKEFRTLNREDILQITGVVQARPENQVKGPGTGEVELSATHINLIKKVPPLPLELDQFINSTEETRLKYRYIDLRRPEMQHNLVLRHKITIAIREFLDQHNFLEIETPILANSTPEGARDYLVPSRVNSGKFFALPQSPQQFKQLLMVGGMDRYFQLARCFRDEDLRADRQPEFTQLDLEMSFIDEEGIYTIMEQLMQYVWKKVLNYDLKIPFKRISYREAKAKYDSDKPDTRPETGEKFSFCWVVDFPEFEYSQEEERWVAVHHPFTCPKIEDVPYLHTDKGRVHARAYDLVLNGYELGGGSIRIHDSHLQAEVFRALGLTEAEAQQKFGFFLDALKFAPPHGGIAFGLDRWAMLMAERESIREVIAFPKNKDAQDLMNGAPSEVDDRQLVEAHIKLR